MKKVLIIFIAAFIGLVLFLLLAKDTVAKTTIERSIKKATGLRLQIDNLDLNILDTSITINNLKLYNPYGYKDEVMLKAPHIYIDYNLPRILKGEFYFHDVILNLSEFIVITNQEKQLNIDSLKALHQPKKEKDKMTRVEINRLELKIGKATYKNYSQADKPSVREFKLNLSETYHNISSISELVSLIVVRAVANTAISKLTGFDLKEFEVETSALRREASDIAVEVKDSIKEGIRLPFGR